MMCNLYRVSTNTECNNKRLSAKTNLKLAKLWLDRGEYTRLSRVGSPYLFVPSARSYFPIIRS